MSNQSKQRNMKSIIDLNKLKQMLLSAFSLLHCKLPVYRRTPRHQWSEFQVCTSLLIYNPFGFSHPCFRKQLFEKVELFLFASRCVRVTSAIRISSSNTKLLTHFLIEFWPRMSWYGKNEKDVFFRIDMSKWSRGIYSNLSILENMIFFINHMTFNMTFSPILYWILTWKCTGFV